MTTYDYNALYELTSAAGAQSHALTYDSVNNRVMADGVSYASNNLNQYTSVGGVAYTYDGNGNLKTDGRNTYVYDEVNRLSSLSNATTTAAYEYDAFDRRVAKTVNGVKEYFISDGDDEIAEYGATGSLEAEYVYGDNIDEVLTMERGGSVYYYHYDGLGSVSDISDAGGIIAESYDYDAYGRYTVRLADGSSVLNSAIGNPFFFTGRRFDPESGLYHYRARAYDPTTGRFLQRDPVGYYDSMNLYQYTGNNPVNWVDPMGENPAVCALVQTAQRNGPAAWARVAATAAAAAAAWEAAKNKWKDWWQAKQENKGDKAGDDKPRPSDFEDSSKSPGEGWEWKGGEEGSWWNGSTGESLRPELGPNSHGPHWDYTNRNGERGRVYPDGRYEPK